MRNYEVTFIVDPVLSSEAIDGTARNYEDHLKKHKCAIVNIDRMGLRQLAYTIKKRTSGVYYCIEFQVDDNDVIDTLELALRRDERIMRFLTVSLDKYGVKYNDDKRNGLIGKSRKDKEAENGEKEQPPVAATRTEVKSKSEEVVAAAVPAAPVAEIVSDAVVAPETKSTPEVETAPEPVAAAGNTESTPEAGSTPVEDSAPEEKSTPEVIEVQSEIEPPSLEDDAAAVSEEE